jgi:serine/threonine protein kinase
MSSEKLTSRLGKCTLHEAIGSGAFGTVYRAMDPVGRTDAIKVINPDLVSAPPWLQRFQHQAQGAAELFDPYPPTIPDFADADGGAFLVMPSLPRSSAIIGTCFA